MKSRHPPVDDDVIPIDFWTSSKRKGKKKKQPRDSSADEGPVEKAAAPVRGFWGKPEKPRELDDAALFRPIR